MVRKTFDSMLLLAIIVSVGVGVSSYWMMVPGF